MYTNPHPDEVRFEYPDPTPVELEIPEGPTPNTLDGLMAAARARQELAQRMMIEETYEEADDFDVEDDLPDYGSTRWEFEADAAGMDPDKLFHAVYGITREEALARLQVLKANGGSEPGGANSETPGEASRVPEAGA